MILPNGNSPLKHATICSILSLLLYSHYIHYNVCTQSDPSLVQPQEPHPTGYCPYWILLHVIQPLTLEPGTLHHHYLVEAATTKASLLSIYNVSAGTELSQFHH